MAPLENRRLIFNKYVTDGEDIHEHPTLFKHVAHNLITGYPVPGETLVCDDTEVIDPDTVSLDGGCLVKLLVLSIDPYLRRRMIEPDPLNSNLVRLSSSASVPTNITDS